MRNKQWRLIRVMFAVFLVLSVYTGIVVWQTPMADTTNFDTISLSDDLTIGDQLDINGSVDLDGTSFDVDVTGAASIDADTASNFSTSAQDITIEAETGSIIIKGDEAAADAVKIDANDAVTTGLDIDVGSVSGVAIDGGLVDIGGGSYATADGDNDLGVAGDAEIDGALDVDGNATVAGTLGITGMTTVTGGLTGVQDTESVMFPTILSVPITYTAAAGGTGTVATIADGEVWFVHKVFANVTTNFDATGDDATLTVGDGNVAAGFLNLADASLQTTFTEATGFAAGWAGIENGSAGAYTTDDGGPFVYAPSGAAETIDWAIAASGNDLSAGAATIYVIYTRVQ